MSYSKDAAYWAAIERASIAYNEMVDKHARKIAKSGCTKKSVKAVRRELDKRML
jgi:hypothetical protein